MDSHWSTATTTYYGSYCSKGLQIGSKVDKGTLDNLDYFHGILPREEIQHLLQWKGDFIIRETKKGDTPSIVLSVCWDSGLKHFIILNTREGKYRLEGNTFHSIPELINYYLKTQQPVTKKSQVRLRRPVKRERWELRNDDIEFTRILGKGNFGDVWQGFLYQSGNSSKMEVAIKTCKESMPVAEKRKFLREARLMRRYIHPNVVRVIGICAQRDPMMIVMELITGGCLTTYLKKNKVSPKEKSRFCLDAGCGMAYLESQKCLHRDLAARNCLLGRNNTVKISDFGMSREGSVYMVRQANQIPIKWTAPEAFLFGGYTSKSDVWSYGILIWEIFSDAQQPYPELNNKETIDAIKNGYRMTPPPDIPESLATIMNSCWEMDPECRPSFAQIKQQMSAVYMSVACT